MSLNSIIISSNSRRKWPQGRRFVHESFFNSFFFAISCSAIPNFHFLFLFFIEFFFPAFTLAWFLFHVFGIADIRVQSAGHTRPPPPRLSPQPSLSRADRHAHGTLPRIAARLDVCAESREDGNRQNGTRDTFVLGQIHRRIGKIWALYFLHF
jgi:hypothetical protein